MNCKVCGAKAPVAEETCDRVCARALKNKCGRDMQMRFDLRFAAMLDKQQQELERLALQQRRQREDDEFYNQPYLKTL